MKYADCLESEIVPTDIGDVEVQIYSSEWAEDEFVRRTVSVEQYMNAADDPDAAWRRLTALLDANKTRDEWPDKYLYVYWAGPSLADGMLRYLDSR